MSYYSSTLRRVRLPERLSDLAEHFQTLSVKVRESVAEAIGETVALVVKDSLHRLWHGQSAGPPTRHVDPRYEPGDWRSENAVDPWEQETATWEPPEPPHVPGSNSPIAPHAATPKAGVFALAMHAAGWWLHRRGTWLGALGVGLLVGSAALLGGRAIVAGLGLAETAHDIFALNNLLASGAAVLAGA